MINSELNKISDWLKLNKLSLNTTKSKCLVLHRPQKHVMHPKIQIDNVELERVKEFNFLGIVLTEQLTWKNKQSICPARLSEQCYLKQVKTLHTSTN